MGSVALEALNDQVSPRVFSRGQHLPQLDGLRGLAILLVTLYRFAREIPTERTGDWIRQTVELGAHGVELFFVLSGFLITGILLDSLGQPNQLKNFFARRSLRILPLYFAALVICLWFIPALAVVTGSESLQRAFAPACDQQLYLWSYLTNVRMSLVDAWCFGPMDHFWSLAVEEHFYLLWPLVIWLVSRRWLSHCTVILLAVCVITRTGWLMSGGTATVAEVSTLWRCDGLLIGGLIAIWIRSNESQWPRATWLARWLWLPLVTVAIAIDLADRRMWLVNNTLWNAVWGCLLIQLMSVHRHGSLSRFFQQTWLRTLGKLSYGMYVFQAPLIPLLAAIGWSAGVSFWGDLLYVPVMLAVSLAVAWCSWHGFEKHWLRLKDLFPQSGDRAVERTERTCPTNGPESAWKTATATP